MAPARGRPAQAVIFSTNSQTLFTGKAWVTGNLDGNLLKISFLINTLTIFN
jgi:hypothetical protein